MSGDVNFSAMTIRVKAPESSLLCGEHKGVRRTIQRSNRGRVNVTPSDSSTPFWASTDTPEQVTPQEPAPVPPAEAAPDPVSLGILPAAPVAANTEPDAEPPPSVDLPEEAFTQEEDGVGATMTGVFFLLFFSVVWIGVTAVATVVITGDLAEQHRTRTWEETSGKMDRSWVSEEVSCDEEGCSTNYCVKVRYSYGYGNLLSGEELSKMEDCYASSRLASKMIDRYPAGSEVTVYHHPDDLNDSVLETGLALRYMWVLVFMLPFQGISLVLLYLLQSSARSALFGSDGHGSKGSS